VRQGNGRLGSLGVDGWLGGWSWGERGWREGRVMGSVGLVLRVLRVKDEGRVGSGGLVGLGRGVLVLEV
jgi:hypothetical protein